jgi:glutamate racemase
LQVPAYLRRNKAAIAAETAALTEFMRLREQPVRMLGCNTAEALLMSIQHMHI